MKLKFDSNKNLPLLTIFGYTTFSLFVINVIIQLGLHYVYNNSFVARSFLYFICNDSLFSTFISILTGLDAAILALAIPLMGDRKIKIQELYQSENLNKILNSDELLNHYHLYVMMHLTLGVVVLLLSSIKMTPPYELIYLSLISFFAFASWMVIVHLVIFITRYSKYESNPLDVSSKQINSVKKIFIQNRILSFFI